MKIDLKKIIALLTAIATFIYAVIDIFKEDKNV